MGQYTCQPSGDWRNDGWNCVGFEHAYQCWDSDNDSCYTSCPDYKGAVTVQFPVDVTGIPAGAVITSVAVVIRCATGSGTPPSSTAPSLTVALSCSDDTSKAATRTVFPTSTIATFEVATFKSDAQNLAWDIERLNNVLLQAYSYEGIADEVRCHQLYLQINYRVVPTVAVTAPSGIQSTSSPVISWTYSQTDGDKQDHSVYKIFTGQQQSVVSFDPNKTVPIFTATVAGDISSVGLPTSLDSGTYWVYVQSYSSFQAKSIWVGRQFSVNAPSPGVPVVPPAVLGTQAPGSGVIQTVPDPVQGSVTLFLNDTSNMMSIQDGSAELLTDGSPLTAVNCTPGVQDTTTAFPGDNASWQMSSNAAGDMTLISDWIEVEPNSPVTISAQFITSVSSRNCSVSLAFYDSSFNALGGTIASTPVMDATGTWTPAMATGIVPTSTFYALATFTVSATAAAAEVHNIDHLGVMYGTNTPWSDGGQISRNLMSSWYSSSEGSPAAGEAWNASEVCSVSTTGTFGVGSSGIHCQQVSYNGFVPTIAWRAAGSVFTTPSAGTDFTLNKPSGVVEGDLMVAFVNAAGITTMSNPPAGWTYVDRAVVTGDPVANADVTMFVLTRSATASEPASWSDGTTDTSMPARSAFVVAYSGAADASLQFLSGEAANSTNRNTPPYLTSATVSNTDPNAWRISAFAFADDASGGSVTANLQAPASIPNISYVGRSAAWTSNSTANSYTINRPSGVVSGDLMVATVGSSGSVTFTPPTGWTVLYQEESTSGNYFSAAVMYRRAGASEPGSWTGTETGTYPFTHARVSDAVAYRNVNATTPFITNSGRQIGAASSLATPSATNTNSRAWRLSVFMAQSNAPASSNNWTASTGTERCDDAMNPNADNGGASVAMYDSNGTVGTGASSVTGQFDNNFYDAAAWIGFLNPLLSAPTPPGSDTSRASSSIGVATTMYGAAFDSNGPAALGNQSVTGIFSPGDSDGAMESAAGWVGFISPISPTVSGFCSVESATNVDISSMDQTLLTLAGNQLAATASFMGSSAGSAYFTANFYRANQLIESDIAEGDNSFGTTAWAKSSAVFDIPAGTTRIGLGISIADRNVGDVTYFDRVSIALGSDTVYRTGTSAPVHPVWAVPVMEYANDSGSGYSPWALVPGTTVANPPGYDALSGESIYVDHTVVPLTNRKYRAKTVVYGLAGDQFVSAYGPESNEFTLVAGVGAPWWLKDISNPANNLALNIKYDNVDIGTTNSSVAFQGLGATKPVTLTEGFTGDYFTLTLVPVDRSDFQQLMLMLRSGKTLYLQTDVDKAWWVQALGDITATYLPTDARRSNPIRSVQVSFIEVDPEP